MGSYAPALASKAVAGGRLRTALLLSVFLWLSLFPTNSLSSDSTVLWDIGEKGLFDPTNKAYPINAGVVTVDLGKPGPQCPTGLGHLASGKEPVEEIRFLFDADSETECWLHVRWNPGGSGSEQFEVFANGDRVGASALLEGSETPYAKTDERFKVGVRAGENHIALRHLSGDGLRFDGLVLATSMRIPVLLNPRLKFPTLTAYEAEAGEPGVMLDSEYVRLLAPQRKAKAAEVISPYLVKAYDELHHLTGFHTQYKMVIYHFPKGSEHAWGGTSNCTIWYSEENLDLDAQSEWQRHRVPHVSGYIEEMAHNFVSASQAQFGWEMIGWALGATVTQKVAGNPVHDRHLADTRAEQARTFERYVRSGFVFPADLPANLCDRVHAHILRQCEQRYGPAFWPDFFAEVRKAQPGFAGAGGLSDDEERNERYRVTVDCFDRLKGLKFRELLQRSRISLTTDVKSLHPTDPDWDRSFQTPSERGR